MPISEKSPGASRASLVAWLLAVGYLGAAWYSVEHARESYARGFEAGRQSTADGRVAAEIVRAERPWEHLACDTDGRNCSNKE